MTIDSRLSSLGITVPTVPTAVANYVGYKVVGDLVIISGQLPFKDGQILNPGHLGKTVSLEEGVAAARQCAINVLAQLKTAIEGDWSRVKQCVRLGGFVASTSDFTQHPLVINGASDLMGDVFGEAGRHARAAVGVVALPLGASVEVEAIFQIS
ncbi:RidA family protein [Candidatus Odyssella acanthamoebae]|uniref:Endoribonuclease n=1 Tax=Candidatus Odyssella acanthamoebae TaxID=91604 RepID=A0A077AVE1_9PROT|nr:RidA family protein [Candidatus Paracaedibacter acanthamoebae]AIK97132.1 endoribonuclease [Candidatus Paracaedibacter acanthamoebae]